MVGGGCRGTGWRACQQSPRLRSYVCEAQASTSVVAALPAVFQLDHCDLIWLQEALQGTLGCNTMQGAAGQRSRALRRCLAGGRSPLSATAMIYDRPFVQ